MVAATTQIRVRVPVGRMKNVRRMLGTMGVDAPGVVNMLFAQIELQGRLPFQVLSYETPNAETRAAMREVEDAIKTGKGPRYSSAQAAMDALKSK